MLLDPMGAAATANVPVAEIDFETRSAADIRNGAWMYARHPTTRILCLSFMLPGDTAVSQWRAGMGKRPGYMKPGSPRTLQDLFDYIAAGGLVEAHNVNFEFCIWHWLASRLFGEDENGATGLGAPRLRDTQVRCSAAKAASYALPRSLGPAGRALGLTTVKDEDGGRTMLKLSKPRKARKGEPKFDPVTDEPYTYYWSIDEVPEDFETMYDYCDTDVLAERAVSEAIPDLSPFEYKVWLADFRANLRGVKVDVDLVHAAIALDKQVKAKLNEELRAITGIDKGTQRKDIMRWLQQCEDMVDIHDTAAPTLDWLMEQPFYKKFAESTQRVIFLARNINRTSVTKYVRILKCMDPDDHRVRELVMYHGAATGRWSGKGIQVQNFPRGILFDLASVKPSKTMTMTRLLAWAVEDIKNGDLEWCEAQWGDVLALLSSALRGALVPAEGKVFYVADYSAIEARIVLWLADDKGALQVFYRGDDIYCDIASSLYGRVITKADKDERQFGKVTILGLGYGMGFLTFLLTLRSYNLRFTPEAAWAIIGTKRPVFEAWVKDRLWPRPMSDAKLARLSPVKRMKADKAFKAKVRQAKADLRRLREAREVPEDIIHELALCKFTVDTYRAKYAAVKELWTAQEDAAITAVIEWKKAVEARDKAWEEVKARAQAAAMNDEHFYAEQPPLELKPVVCGKVTWVVEGRWLNCYLPSGRALHYCDPMLKGETTPWGKKRYELRYMGVHKKTKRWSRLSTYGGSIVENIDQGTARDMMAWAMVSAEESEFYQPLATIHDELLAEAEDDGVNHYEEFEHLMVDLPECYAGCPVAAEGDLLRRYQK